jgi:hypothetical protein
VGRHQKDDDRVNTEFEKTADGVLRVLLPDLRHRRRACMH